MVVNYSQGKIYQIVPISNGLEGEIYIGSTTKPYLSQRFAGHKHAYKFWLRGKGGNISVFRLFEKYGVEGCMITLIESVNCGSKDELTAREAFHMKSMICVNQLVPGGKYGDLPAETVSLIKRKRDQEYRDDHKEVIAIKKRKYRDDHRADIAIKLKKYKLDKKDDIAIRRNISRRKHRVDLSAFMRIMKQTSD